MSTEPGNPTDDREAAYARLAAAYARLADAYYQLLLTKAPALAQPGAPQPINPWWPYYPIVTFGADAGTAVTAERATV